MYHLLAIYHKTSPHRLISSISSLILNYHRFIEPIHNPILINHPTKNRAHSDEGLQVKKAKMKEVQNRKKIIRKMTTITIITEVVAFWSQSSRTSQVS